MRLSALGLLRDSCMTSNTGVCFKRDIDWCNAHAQVLTPLTNHVAAVAPAAVIGVACGLLAIVFTVINLKVARLRIALLQVHFPHTPDHCELIFMPRH